MRVEAEVTGIESDVQWAVDDHLTLSASATYLNAELKTNSCQFVNPQFDCSIPGPPASEGGDPQENFTLAPAGTRLPVSPEFKMNAIARYEFKAGSFDAFAQGAVVYQGDAIPVLAVDDAAIIGKQPAYTTARPVVRPRQRQLDGGAVRRERHGRTRAGRLAIRRVRRRSARRRSSSRCGRARSG